MGAVRYGVTSPAAVPAGHIIIVADWGEPAEIYFETVRDLTARGWTVWVMDAAADPAMGAAALRSLIDTVIRPKADEPVVAAGTGAGAVEALLSAEQRPRGMSGLFLWNPAEFNPVAAKAREQAKRGMGMLPADGEHEWVRPDYDLSGRATLVEAWRTANPDLRPKRRPWSWFVAQDDARVLALTPARLAQIRAPVQVAGASDAASGLCAALPACTFVRLPVAQTPPHLSVDPARRDWLDALLAAAEGAHGE